MGVMAGSRKRANGEGTLFWEEARGRWVAELPPAAEAAVIRSVVGWAHPMGPVGFLKAT